MVCEFQHGLVPWIQLSKGRKPCDIRGAYAVVGLSSKRDECFAGLDFQKSGYNVYSGPCDNGMRHDFASDGHLSLLMLQGLDDSRGLKPVVSGFLDAPINGHPTRLGQRFPSQANWQ